MSYRFLPHTADLRAAIEAPDLDGLYQSAADMLRDVLVGQSRVEARERRAIELPTADEAERLYRFLRELLFLHDTERFLPARVEPAPSRAVWGETFDPNRHVAERQLKAVTRHGLSCRREDETWRAEVLFDL